MKSIQKKAISVFLAGILLLGVLPAAFASEGYEAVPQADGVTREELLPISMQGADEPAGAEVIAASEENNDEPTEAEKTPQEEEQQVIPEEAENKTETADDRKGQETVITANGYQAGKTDEREKALIVLDLAMFTQEDWDDFLIFDEKFNLSAIELGTLLEKIGLLIYEAKTTEWEPLEEIRTEDTPNDGTGYIFTEDFAENATPEVDEESGILEAFIPYEGKIYILKEYEEGQILYQDKDAVLQLVLKYDFAYTAAKKAAKEAGISNDMTEVVVEDGMIKAGVAVSSEAGSFIADVPVKEGTVLSTTPAGIDEGTEQILKEAVADQLGAENDEIYVAVYQATLTDGEGNTPKVNAVVTMNTSIELPENPDVSAENTVAQVKDIKVIQINNDYSLTVLNAEAEQDGNTVTSVKFSASTFNYFAFCYTVNYLDTKAVAQGLLTGPSQDAEKEKEEDRAATAEPLTAEGVTIEVMDGNMPEDTEVVFLQLDSFSAKQLAEWAMSAAGK